MDIEQLGGAGGNEVDRIQQLENQIANNDDEGPNNLQGPEIEADKKKKKTIRRPVPKITGHNLLDKEKGLPKLYLESLRKSEKICKIAELKPIKGLNELMAMTREWAFTMNPRFEFDFFLEKCQRVGKTKEFTPHLDNLRRVHKGDLNLYDMMKEYDDRHVDLTKDNRIENYMEGANAEKGEENGENLVDQAENELFREKQDEKLKKIDLEIQKRREARIKRNRNLEKNKVELDAVAQINESYRKHQIQEAEAQKGTVGSPKQEENLEQKDAEVALAKANHNEAKREKKKFGNLPKFEYDQQMADDRVLDVKLDRDDLDHKIKKKVKLNPDADAGNSSEKKGDAEVDADDEEYYAELARIEAEFAAMDEIERMEGDLGKMDI